MDNLSILGGKNPLRNLVVIRHGESEHLAENLTGGWTDTPLTSRGKQQARETGKRMKTLLKKMVNSDSIQLFTSDLNRAKDTARIIAETIDQEPTSVPALREINNGVAKGRSLEEAKQLQRSRSDSLIDWIPYENGESRRMLYNRVSTFLERLHSEKKETIIIVSHLQTIACIIHWWLELPVERFNTIFYHTDPCSITILAKNRFNAETIKKLNETAHLSEELFTIPT